MNKKGGLTSIFVAITFVVIIGIVLYFLFTLVNNVFFNFNNEELSAYGNSTVNQIKGTAVPLGDTMIIIIFLGIVIALIVTAVYIDMNPVLIGLFLIIFIIFGIGLSMFMANAHDDFDDTMSGEIQGGQSFTFSNVLFGKYFPIIIGFVIVVFIIILYSKSNGGGGF